MLSTSKNKSNYSLKENVFLFMQDDVAQILDFDRGEFYGLDPIATIMVSSVLEKGIEETILDITQIYEVNEDRARTDLSELIQNLEQKRLIISQEKENNSFSQLLQDQKSKIAKLLNSILLWSLKRVSSIFNPLLNKEQTPTRQTVELLLTLSWMSFRFLGWSRTIYLWQHWHQQPEESDISAQEEVIKKVDRVVREAAAWKLFLPMVCKERALVGYHILRTFYRLPASLVVGVDHYPFQIHAWVECDDKIVTDNPEHCEPFIPVVSYS